MSGLKRMRRQSGRYAKTATHAKRMREALDLAERYARFVDSRTAERAVLFGEDSLTADERQWWSWARTLLRALVEAKLIPPE